MADTKKFITLDNLKKFVSEFKKSNIAGSAIIDVNELPLSNIDNSKIYRVTTSTKVVDKEAASEHSVDYKTFVAGTYLSYGTHNLEALENNLSNFSLIKDTDYFLFPIPGDKGENQNYLILLDFINFYKKLATLNNSIISDYNYNIDWSDKTAEEAQTIFMELASSWTNEDASEEDIASNHIKLRIIHITPEMDGSNWLGIATLPNQETGKYDLDGSSGSELSLSTLDTGFWSILNADINPIDGSNLGITVDLNTTSHFANLNEVIAAYLEESNYELRYFWIADTTDIEIPEESHIEYTVKLYTHELAGWKELGGSSGTSEDLDYASEEDIELIFGIVNLKNVQIEDTTLVVSDDVTIDEDYHLLNLDGDEYIPEDNSGK